MEKNKRTALITGASSGIGSEFALLLAARGFDLVLASRNKKKLAALKNDIEKQFGIAVTVIAADLAQSGSAEALYKRCRKARIEIDLLVNNAGVGMFGKNIEKDSGEIAAMLNLNINSLTVLCNLFGRDMARRGRGDILNVSSLVGSLPSPFFASYAASKSYVTSFSLSLRHELKGAGVNVTCLMPGFVKTAFDDNAGITSPAYMKVSKMNGMAPGRVAEIGLKALFKKKARVIPGLSNKLSAAFTGCIPGNIIAWTIHFAVSRLTAGGR